MVKYENIRRVYSFDNGRGNISACVRNDDGKPAYITEKGGELSGYAVTKNKSILIGADLSGVDFDTFKSCQVSLDLKKRPTEENRYEFVRYFKAWNKRISTLMLPSSSDKKTNPNGLGTRLKLLFDESSSKSDVWFIGCPSAWSKEDIKLYIDIFREAGFKNPIVVPESVAAIRYCMAAREIKEKTLIVIDFGAYSNDTSGVRDKTTFSAGSYLGAHIIEEMIVCANLFQAKKYVSNPDRLSTALINELSQKFETDGQLRLFLFLQGRILKELYFNKIKDGTLGNEDILLPVTLENGRTFNLFVNVKMISDILYHIPVREMMTKSVFDRLPAETKEEIGDKIYCDCLYDFIDRIALQAKDITVPGDTAVILTGGASAMDFVAPLVSEKFRGCTVSVGSNPVGAVAEGLIHISEEKLLHLKTMSHINNISEEGTRENREYTALIAECFDDFYDNVLYSAVKEGYKHMFDLNISLWRRRAFTTEEVYKHMRTDTNNLLYIKLRTNLYKYINASSEKIVSYFQNFDGGAIHSRTDKNVFFDPELTLLTIKEMFIEKPDFHKAFKDLVDILNTPAQSVFKIIEDIRLFNSIFIRRTLSNKKLRGTQNEALKLLNEIFTQKEMKECFFSLYISVFVSNMSKSNFTLADVFPNVYIFGDDEYNTTQIT